MKSLMCSFPVILVVFGLIFFVYSELWGADWKPYARNEHFYCYYDAENLTRSAENTIRVWTKNVYTNKGVNLILKNLGKEYKNLEYSVQLNEMNCIDKMINIASGIFYSKEGDIISKDDYPDSHWRFITPDSSEEILYKKVCK
ncbi:MAG: hypothetical protein QME90_11280 [Thermodesulfobacteriota bacterium]|nr:hypothetical protein [Thermodesulfobacteriota bacterium]